MLWIFSNSSECWLKFASQPWWSTSSPVNSLCKCPHTCLLLKAVIYLINDLFFKRKSYTVCKLWYGRLSLHSLFFWLLSVMCFVVSFCLGTHTIFSWPLPKFSDTYLERKKMEKYKWEHSNSFYVTISTERERGDRERKRGRKQFYKMETDGIHCCVAIFMINDWRFMLENGIFASEMLSTMCKCAAFLVFIVTMPFYNEIPRLSLIFVLNYILARKMPNAMNEKCGKTFPQSTRFKMTRFQPNAAFKIYFTTWLHYLFIYFS